MGRSRVLMMFSSSSSVHHLLAQQAQHASLSSGMSCLEHPPGDIRETCLPVIKLYFAGESDWIVCCLWAAACMIRHAAVTAPLTAVE